MSNNRPQSNVSAHIFVSIRVIDYIELAATIQIKLTMPVWVYLEARLLVS